MPLSLAGLRAWNPTQALTKRGFEREAPGLQYREPLIDRRQPFYLPPIDSGAGERGGLVMRVHFLFLYLI